MEHEEKLHFQKADLHNHIPTASESVTIQSVTRKPSDLLNYPNSATL